jgi:hypothetical protein
MKKLLLLTAIVAGATSAAQAEIGFNIGFRLPLPPPPAVVFGRPAPVVIAPAPAPVCVEPAPVVVAPAPVCNEPYRHVVYESRPGWHYCYVDHRWEPMYDSCYFRGYHNTYGHFPKVIYPHEREHFAHYRR